MNLNLQIEIQYMHENFSRLLQSYVKSCTLHVVHHEHVKLSLYKVVYHMIIISDLLLTLHTAGIPCVGDIFTAPLILILLSG